MTKRAIAIRTADGMCKAALFKPDKPAASRAGVILYMDAFGPRPALDQMAERLAHCTTFSTVVVSSGRSGSRPWA